MGAIIWLASYPKSGNTWLRAFLFNLLRNPPQPASINELDSFCIGESAGAWYAHRAGHPIGGYGNGCRHGAAPAGASGFYPGLSRIRYLSKPIIFWANVVMYALHTMDVTAGAIYVVRNPLDVVISMTDHFGVAWMRPSIVLGDPRRRPKPRMPMPRNFIPTGQPMSKAGPVSLTPACTLCGMRICWTVPTAVSGNLPTFLGLTPPNDRLRKAIKFSSFETLKAQEQKHSFKERSEFSQAFFRSGRKQQWRSLLSPAQIDRIVAAHNEQMARFDYLP